MKIINIKNYKTIEVKNNIIILDDVDLHKNANTFIFRDENQKCFSYDEYLEEYKRLESLIK
jgi:hypothetical protein